ncbi:ATP nucleotide 3'-pyrophosphokinase [Streptomyces sp. SID3343]|uniref:ATP nucleotide 3'-pyrophosphokinase n=1 Tax=Streptomyces sp. SID3343 TaxID=2690260 RepID=UPI00136DE83A|nr:ATP nucleotide 3'-pyrophosphokinase [Streptomyces sp. SID3343]MYW04658.1 ATP nucleotide 3'-pyrophosphokinase [Streptomyces sp. SID3343]
MTMIRRAVTTTVGATLAAIASLAPMPTATAADLTSPHRAVSDRRAADRQLADHSVTYQPISDVGWQGEGLSLSAGDNRAVEDFLDRAREAEAVVGPRLRRIAAICNAEVVGFDARLKTPDSLKRKVATSLLRNPDKTVDEALVDLNDSVRYTLQWPTEEYTAGVRLASTLFHAFDAEPTRWKNTWGNPSGYQGVNSNWRDVGTEHVFEVQLHTPDSRHAAVVTHGLYQEQRLPGTSEDRVRELQRLQNRLFGSGPVPEGAADLLAPGLVEA